MSTIGKYDRLLILALMSVWIPGSGCSPDQPGRPPNILFIMLDDMNEWIEPLNDGSRGKPLIPTPHLTKLAERGVVFRNAHTPAPLCRPARASILAGRYPRISDMQIAEYEDGRFPGIRTLTQHFHDHGYYTLVGGKIYHKPKNLGDFWDEASPQRRGNQGRIADPPLTELPHTDYRDKLDWGDADFGEEDMIDVRIMDWASEVFQRDFDRPFFLGIGTHLPHLPWYLPPDVFARYATGTVQLPETPQDDLSDVPAAGRATALTVEIRRVETLEESDHGRILAAQKWESAVAAYVAATRFADAQVGKLLSALESSRYADNTIVVVMSDHGWHLGAKQHWRKLTLWEESTRVPLILSAPGLENAGVPIEAPVSLVDIFPTLVELARIPSPGHELDGQSLAPLLTGETDAHPPALTVLWSGNAAVRDRNWRYIRYRDGSEELYDHRADPREWVNLIHEEQNHTAGIDAFREFLSKYE